MNNLNQKLRTFLRKVGIFFFCNISFLSLYSQNYMELVVRESCECMEKEPSKLEDTEYFLKCVMIGSMDYSSEIQKNLNINVDEKDGFFEFLKIAGVEMAKSCPNFTPSIFDDFKNNSSKASKNNFSDDDEITFCNITNKTVLLAIGIKSDEFKSDIITAGWYDIEPNKCQQLGNEIPKDALYYYAFSTDLEIEWKSLTNEAFDVDLKGSFKIEDGDGCYGCKPVRFKKYIPENRSGISGVFLKEVESTEFITYKRPSKSKFKFCNKTNEDVLISIGLDLDEKSSLGWFVVEPSNCYQFDGFLPEELLYYYAFNASGYEWKDDGGKKFKINKHDIYSLKESEFCSNCEREGFKKFNHKNRIEESEFQVIDFYLSEANREVSKINPLAALFAITVGAAILLDSESNNSSYNSPSVSDKNRQWLERQQMIDYEIRRAEQREAQRSRY